MSSSFSIIRKGKSNYKIICITIFLFIFFKTDSELFADSEKGSISGLVIDKSTNEVITSAQIILESSDNDFIKQTKSDLSGKYHLTQLSEGSYILKIKRIGYKNTNYDVSLKYGEEKSLNLYLEPIELEIEKINVTATKTEQTLQKTPSSISLISSEEIKNKDINTFDQILEDVQGITINRTSGINVSSLSIRGSSDVAGGGIGNRVLLLLDGRPSLTGDSKGALWSLIPVSIIERTEVVKGAFSSLYGSSAIGGVINVITKKPTYKPFTSFNLSYGFYEKLGENLRFSDELLIFKGFDAVHSNTRGEFSYLLNFNYKQNDGYAQQKDYEFYSGIAKVMYDLFANRDLEFTVQYTNSESGFPHYWRKDPGKLIEPYKIAEYYIGDKINKESYSFDVFYRAIPNSNSIYSSRFYFYKLNSISTYNSNNPVSFQYGTPGSDFKTFITSYNFGNISQIDFELSQFNYLITGIDVQWNVVRSSPSEILYGDQQLNNFGFFVQDKWDFVTDKFENSVLSSTVGGRVDYNKYIGGSNIFQFSPKLSVIFSPSTTSAVFENTSYRFLVGRAFRAPSIAELYFKKELFGGFDFIYNPNLKPEEMVSFEIGLRKQYESRFTLDISVYINLYNNLIQYVNIGSGIYGPFQVQNVAKSQIKGLDFLINYSSNIKLFKDIFLYNFDINYSYIDARDLSAKRVDDFLPYKPKHVFHFGTNFLYKDFNLNLNGRYISKVDEVLFFKFEEPEDYFIMDIKLGKKITGNISAYFAINNVFNIFYQELERMPTPNRNYNAGLNIEF